jgi:Mrp family chromosome partitioning ATPase
MDLDVEMSEQSINFFNIEPLSSNPINWGAMQALEVDSRRMTRNRIVSYERTDPSHIAFDMMRTKVLRDAQSNRWHSLGITSPTAGCGKTTIALNLALSLARQEDLRVVLLDLDLRRPRLAKILGHSPDFTTQDLLSAHCSIEGFFTRIGGNLAIGASPESMPHPAELLHNRMTTQCLLRLQHALRADIVIYDLPPMLVSDDCAGFLPNVDRVMLVAAAEASTIAEIDVCERDLSEQEKLLGVVLNKCRTKESQYDNYQN